jgi:hypothetical protein
MDCDLTGRFADFRKKRYARHERWHDKYSHCGLILQGRSESGPLFLHNGYSGGKMIIKELEDLKREVLKLKDELKRLKEEHRNARIQELRQTARCIH